MHRWIVVFCSLLTSNTLLTLIIPYTAKLLFYSVSLDLWLKITKVINMDYISIYYRHIIFHSAFDLDKNIHTIDFLDYIYLSGLVRYIDIYWIYWQNNFW